MTTATAPTYVQPPEQADGILPAKKLNLSRFSYPKPTTTQKTKTNRLPRKPASLLPLSPSESTAAPPVSNTDQTNLGLSLSELAKISRCVCCDISWTTRKTGLQKMAHMRNCARKHAFDEETMQMLLQTEVRNFIPVRKTIKGMARLVSEEPAYKKTFLEDVGQRCPKAESQTPAARNPTFKCFTNPYRRPRPRAGNFGELLQSL
ncbi:hypothetical protein M413DRAFT_301595 [Hebeloma cylindrosporum]|uniref:Uncharacterized protein n=1 Tax=Hebeloma cylindrosporum TaxID=76867 RepID=A0A0C2Y878_HEBCY|nr:hypothetical protein M413DRAFT_301595 [Hebeloma cylindrosporum h7]